jgi:steroid delta-isomerase-like uncharacterized protein
MTTATPSNATSNADVLRWAFEILNTRDITPLREWWTDATVERFPQRTYRGSEELARYFDDTFAALPDFHIKIVCIAEQGDDVFVHWHLTGTHTGGAFNGIEATGRPVALDGIDHFVMRDAKIVSNFVVFDQMQFARQVGLMPPDGTRADRAVKSAFNARSRLLSRLHRR